MENKKDPQIEPKKGKKWKKLTEEAKVGIVITLSATLFFGGILAINSIQKHNYVNDNKTTIPVSSPSGSDKTSGGEVGEVYNPLKELLKTPVKENITLSRAFYDQSDDDATRATAIVHIGGDETRTLRNFGVDYSDATAFNVYASFSGTVIEKSFIQDYGNVLVIKHESGIVSRYTSLGETMVNKGQQVRQGDVIATAGESPYTSELNGKCVHFELKDQDNKYVNPIKSYEKLVKDL